MRDKIPLGFDNTLAIKALAARGIPPIPKGGEDSKYEVGETVQSSGLGHYKVGVPVTIAERYTQNGYVYYRDDKNIVHRTKDLC